jgi:maleylpyruvate isomerase
MFSEIDAATDRLLADCTALTDRQAAEPSLLPQWSRGHVLNHLALQAPALERLLDWARTGVETPQYPDRRERDRAIEDGAARPAAALVEAVGAAAARLRGVMAAMPQDAWQAAIRPITGEVCTAERVRLIRLRELEVHHVDLDLGYGFHDIPAPALDLILADVAGTLARRADMPRLLLRDPDGRTIHRFGPGGPDGSAATVTVTASRADALAWLSGRAVPAALACPAGLPRLPRWI